MAQCQSRWPWVILTMADNPLIRRGKKQCTGTLAEKRTSKRLGAKLTPASGALEGAKSDMVLGSLRIENKSTVHLSMKIELDWLLKIKQEALERGQTPAVTIQFCHGSGQARDGGSWVLIPESILREVFEV